MSDSGALLGERVTILEVGELVDNGGSDGDLVDTDGSDVSHEGARHASVNRHIYCNSPSTFAQSHTKDSNVSPQQVSVVPSVQRDPSSEHEVPTLQVDKASVSVGDIVSAGAEGASV